MEQSWQRTRNSLEAAALEALGIAVQSVSMIDHRTHESRVDFNLAPATDLTLPDARDYRTGVLRAGLKDGTLEAAHPFRITLAAMHNRSRLLDAQKGAAMNLTTGTAPCFFVLHPGPGKTFPAETPHLKTYDQDLAIALITCGAEPIRITHDGQRHIYTLTRCTTAGHDLAPLWHAYKTNAVFPAMRWQPFGLALHALHCLRERRKLMHSERFVTIAHRTLTHQGAAVPEHAPGSMLGQVQKTLGIKL